MHFFKKSLKYAAIAALLYFILSNHFIFFGMKLKLLRKSTLTLKYTIFSVEKKTPKNILKIKELREDGIGKLLVEMKKMSQDDLEIYEEMLSEDEP